MPQSLGHLLLDVARQKPAAFAFRFPKGQISYDAFAAAVIGHGKHLIARGVTPQSLIAIDCDDWVMGAALVFAASMIGCAWVEARPDLHANGINVSHYFYTDPKRALSHPRAFQVDRTWATPPAGHRVDLLGLAGPASGDAPYALLRSSGTTGTPKYMTISHGLQDLRLAGRNNMPPLSGHIAFPPLSFSGSQAGLGILLNGGTIVLGSRLDVLAELGTQMVSASPAQADALIARSPSGIRLPMLGTGGGLISRRAIESWLNIFDAIAVGYGTTEVGVVATSMFAASIEAETGAYRVLDSASVEIVDSDGKPLPEGVAGEVRLRTSTMVSAYRNRPDLSESHFRDGWFYPGDIGVLSAGSVRLVGRLNDQFDVGGIKVNGAQVDEVARSVPGIHAAMCYPEMTASGVTQLALLVHADRDADGPTLAAAIRSATGAIRHTALVPKAIYFVDKLPYTDTGKLVRHQGDVFRGSAAAH